GGCATFVGRRLPGRGVPARGGRRHPRSRAGRSQRGGRGSCRSGCPESATGTMRLFGSRGLLVTTQGMDGRSAQNAYIALFESGWGSRILHFSGHYTIGLQPQATDLPAVREPVTKLGRGNERL